MPIVNETKPSVDLMRSLLDYDPETGSITWRPQAGRVRVGKIAGYKNSRGYLLINLNKGIVRAHRAAFALMTGEWPEMQVDHINGNKLDNRWENLRICENWQNSANKGIIRSNTSGIKGVWWNRSNQRWHAGIYVKNTSVHLGYFDRIDDAADAYRKAAEKHHGEFAKF